MVPDKPQSILFTGESGAGKTRSARHILSFLGFSSFSNDVKERLSAANTIFELFGNAKTCFNENSSRFTKLTEVNIQKCYQKCFLESIAKLVVQPIFFSFSGIFEFRLIAGFCSVCLSIT